MRVFVAGATGVIGRFLVPGLIAAGHEVTASTRSSAKAGQLATAGATPVVVDGLDRAAVLEAVKAVEPEVIVHQMTALTDLRSFRNLDKQFAVTNELRTTGTDYLLEAAAMVGTRRFIAQSFTGWNNARSGRPVKTEPDPLDPRALPGTTAALAAIKHVEEAVPVQVPEGLVLRYGIFYGHGASDLMLEAVAQAPDAGHRRGHGHLVVHRDHRRGCRDRRRGRHAARPACSTSSTTSRPRSRVGAVPVRVPGPQAARSAPAWLGRLLGGQRIVEWMTRGLRRQQREGQRELGWIPKYSSWRDGFPVWAQDLKPGKAA